MTTPDESSEADTSTPAQRSAWMAFAAMGMTVASCVALGVIVGIWADARLHTAPIFLFVGLLLGCVVAAASVVSQIRRFL
jgi:F0F1-type ATP synthase assembly protein I